MRLSHSTEKQSKSGDGRGGLGFLHQALKDGTEGSLGELRRVKRRLQRVMQREEWKKVFFILSKSEERPKEQQGKRGQRSRSPGHSGESAIIGHCRGQMRSCPFTPERDVAAWIRAV